MKLILLGMAASMSLVSCAQNISAKKVPSVVQNTVQAKFANASDIEWEKKSNLYEAEFNMGTVEYTALIDANGKLVVYKSNMMEKDLPAAVSAAITREHSGYTIDDLEKVEKEGITYYQVELEASGKKDMELVFSTDGSIASGISYIK